MERAASRAGTTDSVVQVGEQLVDLVVDEPERGIRSSGMCGNPPLDRDPDLVGMADLLGPIEPARRRAIPRLDLLSRSHVELDRDVAEGELLAEDVEQVALVGRVEELGCC